MGDYAQVAKILEEREAEIERLRADNERLRAALQKIVDGVAIENLKPWDEFDAADAARNALADSRPAYVKPSIREIKYSKNLKFTSKRNTTP